MHAQRILEASGEGGIKTFKQQYDKFCARNMTNNETANCQVQKV